MDRSTSFVRTTFGKVGFYEKKRLFAYKYNICANAVNSDVSSCGLMHHELSYGKLYCRPDKCLWSDESVRGTTFTLFQAYRDCFASNLFSDFLSLNVVVHVFC